MFSELVFVSTSRGRAAVQLGTCRFLLDGSGRGVKRRWRCVKRTYGCRSFIVTVENTLIKYSCNHNHAY
ncbi:hypothetical protein JYU34_004421 [Plutella xylostella]|uniref:FLYWCH-type domain-containing protein n=1 Tax=Plutella xylostella TaxID=51655 RepID=A0ABQ7QXX8_PLUXY|nr:hypothetical protein JYU34_004421 [Plutella xylostella]